MVPTLCLLGCVLAPAQPPSSDGPRGGDWVLGPRLTRAQELVYRGTFSEEARGTRVQFNRAYRFEARLFVLDTPPRGFDLAVLSVLKNRADRPAAVRVDPVSSSVRLERLRVDFQNKIAADPAVSLAVPLESAPTVECGMIVQAPGGRVPADQPWDVAEPGRPLRTWNLAGTETVCGTRCLKLVGVQQSPDWDRSRADSSAWRRQDTVWVAPRLGVAARVERVIEHREPARREVSQRSVLRYELESSLTCPASLAEDRRVEVRQGLAFRDAAAPLLPSPVRYKQHLDVLLNKINYHLEHQPPTPYREAVILVKRRVEAARRGEAVPEPASVAPEVGPQAPAVAAVGEKAPDFLASDFTSPNSARLARFLGKPVVLVFYHPASVTAPDLLKFAQGLSAAHGRQANILGLAVADDAEHVLGQRTALKLTFPLLHGEGLRGSYGVETTPKIVVLDAHGVVRGTYVGWGAETPEAVRAELRNWLPR
jgi:peroxiredoxin